MEEFNDNELDNNLRPSRNSIRNLAFQSAMQVTEESLKFLLVILAFTIIKISYCYYIITTYTTSTSEPLQKYIISMMRIDSFYIFISMLRIRNVANSNVFIAVLVSRLDLIYKM